jgi:hypothetical protein
VTWGINAEEPLILRVAPLKDHCVRGPLALPLEALCVQPLAFCLERGLPVAAPEGGRLEVLSSRLIAITPCPVVEFSGSATPMGTFTGHRTATLKIRPRQLPAVWPIGDEPFGENLLPGRWSCRIRHAGKGSVGGWSPRSPQSSFTEGSHVRTHILLTIQSYGIIAVSMRCPLFVVRS